MSWVCPASELVFSQSSAGFFSQADTESIAIDDFDGDGYSDVGVIILGENGTVPQVGIALNEGTSGVPGEFEAFLQATLPSPPPDSGSVGLLCGCHHDGQVQFRL